MSASPKIFFDSSLPALVKVVAKALGAEALDQGLVVRDSSGRLRFLSSGVSPSDEQRASIEKQLVAALGAYARADGAIAFNDEPGVQRLLRDPAAFPMRLGSLTFRVLDTRIIGSAWLDSPAESTTGPTRIVFASLKGGVGRSTALAVAASDLARRNKNVLVVDLDLEAPGVGEMLLDEERLPRFGTVDYLVENGLGGVPDQLLADFVGTSRLTSPEGGRVDVVPALGSISVQNPSDTLPKLSRAMLEDIDSNGDSVAVTVKIADMIRRLCGQDPYDAVLIDSRAGLSELTAPTILGLGASVLLFGTAQRQTIQGYGALFAALKLLAERDRASGKRAEWRLLFKAVYAKAGLEESVAARYRDDLFELFAENLYDADDSPSVNTDAITFGIDDKDAPHWPLVIPFSQSFVDFDPVQKPSQLLADFYQQTYRPFLDGVDLILASN